MSPVRRFLASHPWAQYFAVLWIVAWSLVVALLLTDKLNDPSQQRHAITAFCISLRSKAYAPLTGQSSEFARNDVRSAISVYGIAQCPTYTGDLDSDRVSPEAFRPAPAPTPR